MKTLVLGEHDVTSLLTMPECIAVMEEALAALARGEVHQPLRSIIRPEGASGFLGLMPAYRGGERPRYGLKEVCVFPGNPARGLDTHLGAVLLHSGETGELIAIANASAITAIRTAAVSAVATKLLAREDATTLAIIGSGTQARSHLAAIPLVRNIRHVRIHSRRYVAPASAGDQEEALRRLKPAPHYETRIVGSVEEAIAGADIIVTATSSKEPILRREWIAPGTHINAVGSSVRTARELDSATIAAGKLFVDRRESTTSESGDYLFALQDGAISADHIRAEIGEILIGRASGRSSADEITIFKSLGLAIEDLAAVSFLHDKVRSEGRGTWVEF